MKGAGENWLPFHSFKKKGDFIMHKNHQAKDSYFHDLTPLLDRGFDEKPLEAIKNFSAFPDYLVDENGYIMRFYERA
jgi:hypothetical protein